MHHWLLHLQGLHGLHVLHGLHGLQGQVEHSAAQVLLRRRGIGVTRRGVRDKREGPSAAHYECHSAAEDDEDEHQIHAEGRHVDLDEMRTRACLDDLLPCHRLCCR
jgi:hypothetical protein